MRSSLEIAMERAQKLGPPPAQFRAHIAEQEQPVRRRKVEGHQDKQGACHCGYDQACTTLVCDGCGKKAPHNVLAVIERDDRGMMTTFYYKRCSCGEKKWQYGCEAYSVRRTN